MKTIVLLVHDDEGQDSRLEAALAITRALGGHLARIDVTPSPVIAGDLYVGFGEAAIVSDGRVGEARIKAAVRDRLSREDLEWSWTDAAGDIAGRVAAAAGLADLIILSRALDDHHVPDMRAIVTQILFRTHAPVVAVPPTLGGVTRKKRICPNRVNKNFREGARCDEQLVVPRHRRRLFRLDWPNSL